MNKKAVVILSGGMDSSLCAYIAKKEGYEIIPLHFNYFQRTQARELKAFRDIVNDLDLENKYEIDIDFFKTIGANALVDSTLDIPINGIEEGIPITYVPFRNGIFLSIASAIAEKEQVEAIFIGVVEEDSSGYPDCSDKFIESMENSINIGRKPQSKLELLTPLVHLKKEDIVTYASELNVPLHLTWSCYQNEEKACGVCDSCRLRLKGFEKAGMEDKIDYEIFF